jgi:EAL domain-containing protein (putative c-di-GMP-specific phosphodiesterase class I)
MRMSERVFGCGSCADGVAEPFPFSMAFQPIIDADRGRVYAYEALVRGPDGQSAASILEQVTPENMYRFDQSCRVKAITLAHRLHLEETGALLSINFMPGAVYSPSACIQLTVKTALSVGFPVKQLMFEITESEEIRDIGHLAGIAEEYRRLGFKVALDDFGAGYSGLNVLVDLPVDVVKLDMQLIRGIERRERALTIVKTMAEVCRAFGSEMVAEGVETLQEFSALRECGVNLMQGYLFAKPGFENLPEFVKPVEGASAVL